MFLGPEKWFNNYEELQKTIRPIKLNIFLLQRVSFAEKKTYTNNKKYKKI